MKALLAGIFITRKYNELLIYHQIMSTMNSLLEKKYGIYFFSIHTPLIESKINSLRLSEL